MATLDCAAVLTALGKQRASAEVAALAACLPPPQVNSHPDGAVYLVWPDSGVEFLFEEGRLTSVFVLLRASVVAGLDGVASIADAEQTWGAANASGANWRRYDRPGHSVHLEFDVASGSTSRVTIMHSPVVEESGIGLAELRAECDRALGPPNRVIVDSPWSVGRVEVRVHEFRGVWVLVTVGASIPNRFPITNWYEFLSFVRVGDEATSDEVARMLHIPAHMQLDEGTAFGPRQTVRWARPLFSRGALEYVALLERPQPMLGLTKSRFLWAVPITRSEYRLVRRGNFSRLMDAVSSPANQVVDIDRAAYF